MIVLDQSRRMPAPSKTRLHSHPPLIFQHVRFLVQWFLWCKDLPYMKILLWVRSDQKFWAENTLICCPSWILGDGVAVADIGFRARIHETQSELKLIWSFTSGINLILVHCQIFWSVHKNLGEVSSLQFEFHFDHFDWSEILKHTAFSVDFLVNFSIFLFRLTSSNLFTVTTFTVTHWSTLGKIQ